MTHRTSDLGISLDGHVATVEMRRPPNNFLDVSLIQQLREALHALDEDEACRVVILASAGKHFCGGADFSRGLDGAIAEGIDDPRATNLYKYAVPLFHTRKPIVAAVQGAATGGGLGLALIADFRVTCPEARFSANFTKLGFHPGFGLTATLPSLVGAQMARLLFYTGRRIGGEEAHKIGLADQLVPQAEIRTASNALAREIAESAPLAVVSTRETMRRALVQEVETATQREFVEQNWLMRTEDFREGTRAMWDRRTPAFKGR